MRKIIVIEFITLDGVMQAPGGSKEDASEGFEFGGWATPYLDKDKDLIQEMAKQMESADYLLGRKTFEIFASYWPQHAEMWPGINDGTKYVVSKTMKKSGWKNSVFLSSLSDIKKLKQSKGADIQVWGSGNLVQTLLEHDLVDELWLKIFPITIGRGKRLFTEGTIPAAFKLSYTKVSSSGVIVANYERSGEVIMRSF
jgi:dihydrofolate reductase